MLPWTFSEEAAAEKHMAQLQHNMWVTASRTAVLSIITDGGKWVEMTILSIGPLIAVCCQATILPLSSDTPVAIAPSELIRLRRRSDRGWRDDCIAGLAIDIVGGFVGLG